MTNPVELTQFPVAVESELEGVADLATTSTVGTKNCFLKPPTQISLNRKVLGWISKRSVFPIDYCDELPDRLVDEDVAVPEIPVTQDSTTALHDWIGKNALPPALDYDELALRQSLTEGWQHVTLQPLIFGLEVAATYSPLNVPRWQLVEYR